ncbi:MAG: hypothetical protein F6K11_13175 [Leptolyngbya sp. SIO3F4]|nr:hypothetical protein [Leptolyngbya sp. SIO3F4]
MKTLAFSLTAVLVLLGACKSNPFGDKVKDPFRGSRYESNARFFRAVGKAQSRDENIAKKKASTQAKAELAGQMNTRIKEVADDYLSQTDYEERNEITEKFQSLTRAVVNTNIADLRKIDEAKYFDGTTYTAFVAYEIKKNAMFRFLKKQAKTDQRINETTRKRIEEMIDAELEKLEED